ncbi:hypothetical protein SO802_010984 [Lithocarpus litseifolius]|uniref:Disease resistance protein RGA3 n=1 Tax=Lithocarpus litseifolius TaxID=425828 RepID=A0AAW2DHZ8_9ROSI
MADTLLIDLFKQLASIAVQLAKQEINLLVGVDEEVQKLQDRLGMIKAMLDDAEERHPVKLRTEKNWLERLQDQYYEMDDILDTWNTARIRAEIEKEGKPADTNAPAVLKKKVCSFVPSPSCCFNLPLRHDVGHMIRKLNEKLEMIFKDKATCGIDFNRQADVVGRPITTSVVDVSNIIGRDIDRDELLRNLLGVGSLEERNSYCVISLVGMGGIGKTTLAQLAYNHPDVLAHFQQRMWVCVSDPFDQCEVAKAIIKEVDPKHPLDDIKLQTLLCEIQKLIKEKKYFLVLDDVWIEDSQKWEPFKLALKNGVHGSRILVTTRKHRALAVMGSVLPINLEVLSDEDCWSIFSKITFSNEEQLKYLEDIGRKLASKCKGLPLAAKTLGSLMQTKRSRELWNKILNSHMWEFEDIAEGLLAPLLLSYYELPSTMRRCFSYCAIFAKDYLFSRDQLVLHWMAQGYIETKADMELEVIAEEYFGKLAMRSFFQDFEKDEYNDDEIIGCKMHDIVHDFAQFMTKNESFEIDGDKKLQIDCQSARHLRLKISKEMQCLESIYCAKNLRTLYLLSYEMDYEFEMLLSNSFHHFKCLRTLILDCPIKKLPDAVENLIHLRCLFTTRNVKIVEFPETLCNLCNLQILKIENFSYFKKLPQGMSKQINLRHLVITDYSYSGGVVFPKGIGKLIGLRTLSVLNIGDKDDREGCKIGELKNLNQLRGSLTIHGMENVVNVDELQSAQLKEKIHLRDLVLCFGPFGIKNDIRRMENDVKVLNALEPPPNLQYLKIMGYKGNTIYPNWMMSWTTLKTLNLGVCVNLEHLPSLGQLPFLEVLAINWLGKLKKVGDEFLGIEDSKNKKAYDVIFPNLKSLQFLHMYNWEEWIGMGGTGEEEEENDNGIVTNPIIMPRLQSLEICYCRKLKSLPDYLLTAPSLKELVISFSSHLNKRYQKGTGENWHKISHISNIKLNEVYVQRDGEPLSDSETTNQHNEFGPQISDKDDVGAGSAECVVEVDNDEGPEICEADR